ncbi:MAG TPA: prepilin-type N-terminal cleavage/methylation domain-containing protein [Acidimicrobiales bacterium]|nr:prepilin-type N-terminal cleavage/methylation domain-containing protein [Acidimicrobiales bacterium]
MTLRARREAAPARDEGFTLVEMVVTVTVIAVLFLAVAVMLDSSLRALGAAKARARGNDIATQGIEDLQRFSFNNLALCHPPSGTTPAGLETWVTLPVCPTPDDPTEQQAAYEDPCNEPAGNIPRREYTCRRNNIDYTVKRYIAWVDSVRTTKRLAVFVEWTDAVGRHQVSQQSSLRAPDQSAITGLAPPKFSSALPPTVTSSAAPSPQSTLNVTVSATNALVGDLRFRATTENLSRPATAQLTTPIGAHAKNQILDIAVSAGNTFPNYNGFPIIIENESFTVVSGAGTNNWRVLAGGTDPHGAGLQVKFVGDQVFATMHTIGSNDYPQTSTVSLVATDWTATSWDATVTAADGFRFGAGSQYVSFGILRAADGKRTAAFAQTRLELCMEGTSCAAVDRPTIQTTSVTAQPAVGYVPLTSGGELVNDLTVKARTVNVSDLDTVSVNFLTQAGSITVTLTPDPSGTACPAGTNTTPGVACDWIGTLSKDRGYRFSAGTQKLYFAALQVLDMDPATIDNGSTASAESAALEFRQ